MGNNPANGMTILFKNVPPTASKYDVIRAIAGVLHSNTFKQKFCSSLNRPLNFHVTLESDGVPSSIRNNGRGTLILPTCELGRHFLHFIEINEIRVCIQDKSLCFRIAPSDQANPELIRILKLVPFQDPTIAEFRENLLKELIYQIPVLKLQLGVFVYNPSNPRVIQFSVEWERDFNDYGDARLAFEFEHKLFKLNFSNKADTILQTVIIKYANMRRLYTGWDLGSPYILFELPTPPAFEEEEKYRTETTNKGKDMKRIRTRLSCLDEAHRRVAPYVHQVRLVLKSPNDLEIFHHMCNKADLAKPISVSSGYMDVFNGALYTPRNLDRIEKWLGTQTYLIAFQCEALIRNHILNPSEFFGILPRVESLIRDMPLKAHHILLHFHTVLKILHNRPYPARETISEAFERAISEYSQLSTPVKHRDDNAYFNAYRVIFTPTAIRLEGPYTHQSNRVIRTYVGFEDRFIRVDFRDEDRQHYRWSRETDGEGFVTECVGTLLKNRNGFKIAGREFHFLGYSSSQLRSHSVFAFSSFQHPDHGFVTADLIRTTVGIFDKTINFPALYAARVSQAFSATEDSVALLRDQWEEVPDIKRNGRTFTDGVGTISPKLAQWIWETLCAHRNIEHNGSFYPAAFQIRFGGYKGVVAVDYSLESHGIFMRLRESMRKFEVWKDEKITLEIARYFQYPTVMYLNRPFIQILEDMGIHRRVFMQLQKAAVASVQTARNSLANFVSLLDAHGLGKSFRLSFIVKSIGKLMDEAVHKMLEPQLQDCNSWLSSPSRPTDAFLSLNFLPVLINTAILSVLRDIKHNARIPVPNSWNLVGVADETGLLKEDEVYVCIWDRDSSPHERSIPLFLEGPVLISRSPMLHPGDVRMATAIGRPPFGSVYELSPMPNVIVFSCQGSRDLPSCLAGGDLDGDLYVVSKHEPLHIHKVHEAAAYPPVDKLELNRPSTIDDVADFVVEYINSDVVGLLSTNHLILSDQSSSGTKDSRCLELARLCSLAVDYPKSGRPVEINDMPRFLIPYKPDWKSEEELNPRETDYYVSTRAIGFLFRAITVEDDGPGSVEKGETRITDTSGATTPDTKLSRTPTPPVQSPARSVSPQQQVQDLFSTALESKITTYFIKSLTPIPATYLNPTDADYKGYKIPPLFKRYALELKYICVTHTLSYGFDSRLKEEEVVLGTILAKCKKGRWHHERIEQMRVTMSQLVYMVLYDLRGGVGPIDSARFATDESSADPSITSQNGSAINTPDQRLLRAWMAWKYARSNSKLYGSKSFGLLALQMIFEAIDNLEAGKKLSGDLTAEEEENCGQDCQD